MKSRRYLIFLVAVVFSACFAVTASASGANDVTGIIASQNDIDESSGIYNSDLYNFGTEDFAITKGTPILRVSDASHGMLEQSYKDAISDSRKASDTNKSNEF